MGGMEWFHNVCFPSQRSEIGFWSRMNRNQGIHCLRIIRHQRNRAPYLVNVMIEATNSVALDILGSNSRIAVGYQRVRCELFINSNRCFNCHKTGHFARSCQNARTCGYCANTDHTATSCPYKQQVDKHRCVNCTSNYDHASISNACPTYQKHINKAKQWPD